MARDPEPPDYEVVGLNHARYRSRDFYGEHAADLAELVRLREWKDWAQRQLSSLHAFERSVHEGLNSGDGAYRP